jgi:hypothetical protein
MRCVVAMFVVSVAGIAWSQPAPPPDDASRLFEEGRTLAKAGQYADACDRFKRSFDLDHGVGTELNLGDCHEHLGHLAEAWRMFHDAAAQFDKSHDDRAKFAHDRASALSAKIGNVVVKLPDPTIAGLVVTVGGDKVVPAAEIQQAVDPGTIEVKVEAPDKPVFTKSIEVVAGATATVEVGAVAAAVPAGPATQRQRNRVYLAWGLAGGGGIAMITSTLVALSARGKYQQQIDTGHCSKATGKLVCDSSGFTATNSAGTEANVATVIGVGALALGAAAAIVYFTAPTEVVIAPAATSDSIGVSVAGRF